MWSCVKDIIASGNLYCPRKNVKDLLDIDDEILCVETEQEISPILAKMKEDANFTEEVKDIKRLLKAIKRLEVIQLAANSVTDVGNNYTFDDEWILFIARATVNQDRWYETLDIKFKPHAFTVYSHCLFFLQMTLRLHRRKKLVLDVPDVAEVLASDSGTLPPICCNFEDFVTDPRLENADGCWFMVYDKATPATKPIREWTPWDIYRALQYLIVSRTMGGYNFRSKRSSELFLSYREALVDRAAMLCLFEIPGSPSQLAPSRPNWFSLSKRLNVDDLPAVGLQGEEYKLLSAKIREEQSKKTAAQ